MEMDLLFVISTKITQFPQILGSSIWEGKSSKLLGKLSTASMEKWVKFYREDHQLFLPCYLIDILEFKPFFQTFWYEADLQKSIWIMNPIYQILTANKISFSLTLFGMRHFPPPCPFLDQILLPEFLSNISKLFRRWKLISIGLIWHPAKLIISYRKCL